MSRYLHILLYDFIRSLAAAAAAAEGDRSPVTTTVESSNQPDTFKILNALNLKINTKTNKQV